MNKLSPAPKGVRKPEAASAWGPQVSANCPSPRVNSLEFKTGLGVDLFSDA